MNYFILNKKRKKRWSQCKQTIFFNMYIVHEYLVEENVPTKTYLLANKIYCMYIPTAFSLWHREGPVTKLKRFYHMTFNAVNHVNFNNNKWQTHATLSLSFSFCVWFYTFVWPVCLNVGKVIAIITGWEVSVTVYMFID